MLRALNGAAMAVVAVTAIGATAGGVVLAALSRRTDGVHPDAAALGVPVVVTLALAFAVAVTGLVLAHHPRLHGVSAVTPVVALAVLLLPVVWLRAAGREAGEREADTLASMNAPTDGFAALGKACAAAPGELSMQGDCPERYVCAVDPDGARRCRSVCSFDRHCPARTSCVEGHCR